MKRLFFYVSFLLLGLSLQAAKVSLPMPTQYVDDQAGIISADTEQTINNLLKELEQKTGVQFVVLTVNSTGGVPIDQYSMELVERWKLGQKGKDNGFLMTVAVQDRKYRFEVGYGLEGFLTDQYCGGVGRDVLVPAMRQGQYSAGIYQSVLAVTNTIASHYNIQLSGIPDRYRNPVKGRRGTPCCFQFLPIILFVFLFLTASGRGSVIWPLWFLLGTGYGAHRNPYNRSQRDFWGYSGGSGFGSGGFGSGGFGGGGFGGGSGGGFGGGGASGGW